MPSPCWSQRQLASLFESFRNYCWRAVAPDRLAEILALPYLPAEVRQQLTSK